MKVDSIRNFILISFAGLLASSSLTAGDTQAVDSLFYRGVAAYERGDYQDARKTFEFLDSVYPSHRRLTASLLMQGKVLFAQNEIQRAIESYREIINDYPKSEYADDARYGLGLCYFKQDSDIQSVQEFLEVVDSSPDQRLVRKAAGISSDIMDKRMRIEDLRTLLDNVQSEKAKATVTLRLARRELDDQHYEAAQKVIQNYLAHYPKGAYVFQMEELLKEAESLSRGMIKVGIILPLSGSFSEQANGVLSGIEYAVKQYNAENPAKIELVIRDSEGRMLNAIKAAQEICVDPEVLCIIGELSSDVTAGIAGVAQAAGLTLLSPVAAEGGLTTIGDCIFQLNADLNIRAHTLAEYAINGLGLRRFAFLGIGDLYGKVMRDEFVKSIHALGGSMLAEKWYFQGANDFSEQFKGLRQAGIEQMFKDSVLVRDNSSVPQTSPYFQYVRKPFSALVDSADLAVTAYDGIFMPSYTEELQYLIPQMAYYNIQARMLGGVPWYDEKLIENNAQYMEGAVFLSDFYISPSDFRYYRFRDAFKRDLGNAPTKMNVFGYDAAAVLLSPVKNGIRSRKEFRDKLSDVQDFPGIRGTISFNAERVNPDITLLQFKDGRIQKIR